MFVDKVREFITDNGALYMLVESIDCGFFVYRFNVVGNYMEQVSPFYKERGNAERWISRNLREAK